MDIFAQTDYRQIIREKVKEVSGPHRRLTLQKLANLIPIQNTYLSKALHEGKTHLNEDHLFKVCHILKFLSPEIDYLFLLRARDVAESKERKAFLDAKISRYRTRNPRSAEIQEFDSRQLQYEMAYLFDSLATLVHVSLFIPEYRKHPMKLGAVLGAKSEKIKEILVNLARLDFIRLNEETFEVTEVLQNQIHYGTDHPLMRAHQSQMRNRSSGHLGGVEEDRKHCFMGTFSADPKAFEEIKKRFRVFLKEVEGLVGPAPSERVYQMNFDLFDWF